MKNSAQLVEPETTTSGLQTLRIGGKYLYSRVNPVSEAQKFADRRRRENTRTLIVIGDDLGHIATAFSSKEGPKKIFVFPICGFETPLVPNSAPFVRWHQSNGSPASWLQSVLRPDDVPGLDLVVWEPARRVDPETCGSLEREISGVIHQLRSELATVATFGRLWLRNALLHTMQIDRFLTPEHSHVPISVVAAGPSLEWFPLSNHALIAVTSARDALVARGVRPSIWVHLDGGFWASRYTDKADREPMAISLRSSRFNNSFGNPVLLQMGWLGESLAPDATDWTAISEAPTVALAALQLAHAVSPSSKIDVVGADFASYGYRFHARPNRSDEFRRARAHRTDSFSSISFRDISDGELVPDRWEDGTPGWQTFALKSYESAFAFHNQDRHDNGAGPHERRMKEPLSFSTHERPAVCERKRHALDRLRRWEKLSEAVVDRSAEAMDVALHLAPTEYLAYLGGRVSSPELAETIRNRLAPFVSRIA